MEKLIKQVIVAIVGKHFGYFDVYQMDDGRYRAVPRNTWETKFTAPEYHEFIFWKEGRRWKTDPAVFDQVLQQIIEECGL